MESIVALFDRYAGKPGLVIGGGPSARADLPKLTEAGFTPAVVLSANEHGLYQGHYKVDFIVNVDRIHCGLKKPMEGHLRPFNTPIINAHSWADYRLIDWRFGGNSGITCIAVAAALGCCPVVVVGIDLFGTGRKYFHDPDIDVKVRTRRATTNAPVVYSWARVRELKDRIKDYPVRPVSGPLTTHFPKWDPTEIPKGAKPTAYRSDMLARRAQRYEVLKPCSIKVNDRPRVGSVVWLSQGEAKPGLDNGWLRRV